MNTIPQALQDRLLDYLDGKLSAEERQALEAQLEMDALLKAHFQDLRALDTALRKAQVEQPSKNFTAAVMHQLNQDFGYSKFPIRNGIFLLAGILVVAGIASLLVTAGVFDQATTTIDINTIDLARKYISQPLPSISLNNKLIVNTIIILNLCIGWLVLDRIILKPFFQRRLQSN